MRTKMALLAAAAMLLTVVSTASAQMDPVRERARIQWKLGWENMKAEAWEKGAKSFQDAIDIDPKYEDAYYGLGRANMAMKKFVEAIAAYTKCRDLYRADAGRQFANASEMRRARENKILDIDENIRLLRSGPQTMQTNDQIRQFEDRRRELQDLIQRGNNVSIEANSVPSWVSLALGSAYFRSGRLADAEREYKAAIEADAKTGEAHSNLAVVYMQTGRIDEAEKSVKAAEKAGFKVNPMLKEDIAARKKAGSN
jgi:Tfp pilus assembly protein PilF